MSVPFATSKSAAAPRPRRRQPNAIVARGPTEGAGSHPTDAQQADEGSLVQKSIQAVSAYIRDHELRLGDTLPGEKYFADELKVSRAVMRETFTALAALNIVDVGNGRKPRVSAVDGSVFAKSLNHGIYTAQISIPEVWDLRRTIEIRSAELAAALRTDDEAQEIAALAESIAESFEDIAVASRRDVAFHQTIARATHSNLVVQIMNSFEPLMNIAVMEAWKTCTTKALKTAMARRHRVLARAIIKKDPEAAGAAMNAHFDETLSDLWFRVTPRKLYTAPIRPWGTPPF
jgi:DNA-binding FadR family transcriptional regulator